MKYFMYLNEEGVVVKVEKSKKRKNSFNLYGKSLWFGGSFNLKTGTCVVPTDMLPLLEYLKQ